MEKPFDIFWFGEKGAIWVEAVETLEMAKEHIEQLSKLKPGIYAVIDGRTGSQFFIETK